jgi:hypothetical protein
MSDNLRRYCAILVALKRLYPAEPTGNLARHLATLAALVCGVVGSRKCHLPAIASKTPDGSSPKGGGRESRAKRFARWLQNRAVTGEALFRPYAEALIASLPPGPLVLIMDGSQAGRGCMVLMLSVLYRQGGKGRALPLCWLVVRAPKGHFAQERHTELVAQAQGIIPPGREVVFLGDGEFDGIALLTAVRAAGWRFVCRTARSALLQEAGWPGETFTPSALIEDGLLRPGASVELADVLFTARGRGLGPVLVGAVWEHGQREPLLLVTDLDFLYEARQWYRQRFGIETLFSDQKSRGFYLCHSRLSDPQRLSRLLIATCLAYFWMVCLGAQVLRSGWLGVIHRRGRCDLSLFQIGLLWLEHCLSEGKTVLVPLQARDGK